MYLGLFIVHPQMVAPALNLEIEGEYHGSHSYLLQLPVVPFPDFMVWLDREQLRNRSMLSLIPR